jgi:replicative DNA helicase
LQLKSEYESFANKVYETGEKCNSLYNIECEQIVLGKLLLRIELLESFPLREEFFYEEAHRRIFSFLKNIFLKQKLTPDGIVCKNFFDNDPLLSQIGGSNYLSILMTDSVGILGYVSYCKILQDLYLKREIETLLMKHRAFLEEPKPASEIMSDLREKLSDLDDENYDCDTSNVKTLADVAKERLLEYANLIKNNRNDCFLETGFNNFDRCLIGLPRKNLVILAGRPSMGKSTLALQMGLNIASAGKNVLYFSQEMSNTENVNKVFANLSGIDSRHYTYSLPSEDEIRNLSKLCVEKNLINYSFFLDDSPKVDINYIQKVFRKLKRKLGNIDLVILDHLQITEDVKKNFSKVDKYGNITADLKTLAKNNNCVVLCLSQINRKSEEREGSIPELSDLKESGDIEQNADQVIFIHRPDYFLERKLQSLSLSDKNYQNAKGTLEKTRNTAILFVRKNRNGRIANVKLYFKPELSRFTDYLDG